ncbi:thioesterase-like superfamily-domain-containing protein [Chaetomium sp. MPI-SDFR-AT-0129]|nr:thioesterase-like superfamily-domain-containing protein [Chaetomium sp. MPI-SDFR-AT-0129]
MAPKNNSPLPLQEALNLVKIPSSGETRRFMGTRSAYLPGSDFDEEKGIPSVHSAAFGGHVYAQSVLAASQAWRELEDERGTTPTERLGFHTITGYFTRPGNPSRPFIYNVTPLTASRTFSTLSVTAYQPSQPSSNPEKDHFPLADASLPLAPPSFTAICSFKLPEPHSQGVSIQEAPPQERFSEILASRPPLAWPPAPPVDITGIVELAGSDQEGKFPIAKMRKVDMTVYNEGRPMHEKRELLLYKLLRPLPPPAVASEEGVTIEGKEPGGDRPWWADTSAHVAAHAYVADRNGLLVVGNHAGFGHAFGRAASLNYTLVVHVNADEAVMHGSVEEGDGDDGGWWVQEMFFPRVAAGRGIVESKIWSPSGVHVATEYQDGLVQGMGLGKL